MCTRTLLVALLLLLGNASGLRADVVHLRGGRQLVGRAILDGDAVRVELDGGTLTVPRSRVERIERAELPRDALERRATDMTEGDTAAALALARDAVAAQLPDIAGRVLERAATWDAEDPALREALWRWRVFERRPPPDPVAAERLRRAVAEEAHIYRSAHWRIAHDTTVEVARERAAALEDAWRAFHDLMRNIGLRPEPIEDRLEAMIFREHADWVRATGAPAESLAGLNGLFVGPTGRILLFDPATAPLADAAHAKIAEAIAQLAEKAVTIDQQEADLLAVLAEVEAYHPTPGDRSGSELRTSKLAEIRGLLGDLEEQRATMSEEAASVEALRDRVRRFWEEETVSATMHEACHQIAFASGIAHGGHPQWLNEGLATLFEATSREALDPTSKSSARVRDLRVLRDEGGGLDLRRVVSGRGFEAGTSSAAYAEAWSLLTFLVLRHPDGLAQLLRARPSDTGTGADDGATALRAFEEAIGDLDEIEREWLRYADRL